MPLSTSSGEPLKAVTRACIPSLPLGSESGAVASLDALVEVRAELGPEATVLMDGGIRRGADVIKAVALGADAVLLGRPYVYGLAVGGQAGVEEVIRNLMAEMDLTLALTGGRTVRELDETWIAASS